MRLLESIISTSSEHGLVVSQHLQSVLIANHLEPQAMTGIDVHVWMYLICVYVHPCACADTATTFILGVLLMVQKSNSEQLNIKLVYQRE